MVTLRAAGTLRTRPLKRSVPEWENERLSATPPPRMSAPMIRVRAKNATKVRLGFDCLLSEGDESRYYRVNDSGWFQFNCGLTARRCLYWGWDVSSAPAPEGGRSAGGTPAVPVIHDLLIVQVVSGLGVRFIVDGDQFFHRDVSVDLCG